MNLSDDDVEESSVNVSKRDESLQSKLEGLNDRNQSIKPMSALVQPTQDIYFSQESNLGLPSP